MKDAEHTRLEKRFKAIEKQELQIQSHVEVTESVNFMTEAIYIQEKMVISDIEHIFPNVINFTQERLSKGSNKKNKESAERNVYSNRNHHTQILTGIE